MTTNRVSALGSVAPVLIGLLALAPAPARAQQAPVPGPEIRRITALAGTFDGSASLTAGGKTVQFTLHHVNRVIAGGFGLQVHENADLPGMGRYEAENLLGWDVGRKRLHLFSVTTDPNTHDHFGPWQDARHVTLRYEGVQDGKKVVEVIPFEIVSADEYRFRSTLTVAGEAPQVFEATMKRVERLSNK